MAARRAGASAPRSRATRGTGARKRAPARKKATTGDQGAAPRKAAAKKTVGRKKTRKKAAAAGKKTKKKAAAGKSTKKKAAAAGKKTRRKAAATGKAVPGRPSAQPEATPFSPRVGPAPTVPDLYSQLQAISTAFAEQYTSAVARMQELAGKTSSASLSERYQGFAQESGAAILRDALQLGVSYVTAAGKLSQRYYEQLLRELGTQKQDSEEKNAAVAAELLELDGELGSTLAVPFVLENGNPAATRPRMLATPLVGPQGSAVAGSMLLFEPETLELAPNQRQSVTLRIPLDAELYERGAAYDGVVAFLGVGAPDRLVALKISVT